jgi:hypothetical protein
VRGCPKGIQFSAVHRPSGRAAGAAPPAARKGEKVGDSPFRPYERLVRIKVLGKTVEVPEKNMLLRCFQYVSPETIPYGRFCWNQECQTCRISYRLPGKREETREVLSCKVLVAEGMEITELSPELTWNLKKALRRSSRTVGAEK